jgi:uncharacterized repeat protein (TIGR02543 family)
MANHALKSLKSLRQQLLGSLLVLALAVGAVFAVGVQLSNALPTSVVTFDVNGGSGTMAAQTALNPTPLTLNSFTRPGNSFQKWNTSVDGSGASYSDGATYSFSTSTTLYAQWVTSGKVVTFNANAGTGYMGPQVSPVAGNLNFNTFTRADYVFTGWTTATDGTGASYADGAEFPFSSPSTTLWAQWMPAPLHTVTFNANDGTGTMTAQSANTSTDLSANAFTLTGSGFSGWNTAADGTGTSYAAAVPYSFTADMTLYAQWTTNTYTVTFLANSGSGSMTAQTFTHGVATTITTNTFTRTNYLFTGWNTESNGSGTAYATGESHSFDASTSLYAQWTNQIPITFDANLGSGTMAPQDFTIASAGTFTANAFTRADYMFTGWDTAANGGGTAYLNLDSATFLSATTVYAQWVSVPSGSAGIVFNPNTGTGTMAAQVASTATAITANTYTAPSGKAFQSWNTAANGTGTTYAAGETYPFTSNVTLYAQWGTSIAISFDANLGSGTTPPQNFTINVQGTLTANTLTRTEHMFIGWNTLANGTGTAYLDLAFATFLVPTTLYAQWISVPSGSAGIVFHPNTGGGTMEAQVASAPIAITANTYTAPSGSGKVFQGWNTAANGTGTTYNAGSTYSFTTNVTLYAQWGYQVTFNANGGSGPTMPPQVGFVSATTLTANTYTQAGYVFVGWTTTAAITGTTSTSFYGDGATVAGSTFTGARTLYAQWAPGSAGDFGVMFLGNGGSTSSSVSVTYQTESGSTALNANPFIRAGKTFMGWAATPSGSVVYAEGTTYSFTASKMLYAVWQTNKVTFDANGGTGTTSAQSSTNDAALTTSGFTRSGFVFSGWNTATGGSGVSYSQNGTYPFSVPNNSTKLYAQWTVVPAGSFYVMFLGNSASGGSMLPQISATSTAFTPNAFTRTGYSFAGWNTKADGTGTSYTDVQTFGFISDLIVFASWKPVLTYKANFTGGAPDETQIVAVPSSHDLAPLSFSRTNYVFVGWNGAADGSGKWYLNSQTGVSDFTTPSSLYARWVAVTDSQHVVIFWPATASGAPTTQVSATSFALTTAPTISAKTFTGWATSAGGSIAYLDRATYSFTTDIILYPVAQANVVTFDANGGSGSMATQTSSSKSNLSSNSFTRSGFTFTGWSTNADGTGTPYTNAAQYSFNNSNMTATLYAQWTPAGYSVTFSANGGTGTMAAQPGAAGASVALSPDQFSYAGKVFTGWNTAVGGTGTNYADGATITMTANVTLYAQWAIVSSHVVTFDANGLTGGTMDDATTSTGSLVLPVNTFSGVGAIFYGWNTVADGSGTGYADHSQITVAADMALYARYITYDAGQVSISFDANGGSGSPVRPYIDLPAATRAAPANPFLRPGYTFAGWNTTANGSGTSYLPASTLTFADTNTTLYAKWNQTWFTVSFYGNNGSGTMAPQTGDSASNLMANTFTRPNYAFVGWNTAANGSGTSFANSVSYPFTADRTLYGQWTATAFTVSFVANAGTGTMLDQTSPTAVTALQANAYSRTGYVFAGWATTADGSGTRYTNGQNYGFEADLTLYARWSAVPVAPTPTPTRVEPVAPSAKNPPPAPASESDGSQVDAPTPAPEAQPESTPSGSAAATIDTGQGTRSQSADQSPLEALLSSKTLTRTIDDLEQESIGGFRQGSSATIRVSGARTTGQFVFSGSQSIDTVAIAAALSESQVRQATNFAMLTTVTPIERVDWSKVATGGATSDATELFNAIGLTSPRTLADLPTKAAKYWLEIRGSATGYVPGTMVYLAVTTDPIILGSARVDAQGNVAIDGLLPIDLLEPAAHSIRIVGTRDLQGVTVGSDGEIHLTAATMNEIQEFDKGTNAIIELDGAGALGPHVAVRLIALLHTLPWWVLWIFLGALTLAFIVRRRKPVSKAAVVALWTVAVGGMLVVEVIAWVDIAYAMLPYAPIATIVVLATDLLITATRRGWRAPRGRSGPRHAPSFSLRLQGQR